GEAAGDQVGVAVANAGDVNNEGFDDVIIGAPVNNLAGNDAGRADVLNGKTGATLWTLNGQSAGDNFGFAVAGIGDIDDDNHDDFVVGAQKSDVGGTDAGRIYVYSGKTKAILQRIEGEEPGDQFGSAVA